MKDFSTVWVIRKPNPKHKRLYAYCQFSAEFYDKFKVWLKENAPKIIAKNPGEPLVIRYDKGFEPIAEIPLDSKELPF